MAAFARGAFDDVAFDVEDAVTNIRNFSLRNWRKWIKDEEEIIELKEQVEQAVVQVLNSSVAVLQAPEVYEGAILLRAMEAMKTYEDVYRKIYKETYVEEAIIELWREDLRLARNKRAAVLLLLN